MMFENVSSRVPPLNGVVAYCWSVEFSFPSAQSHAATELDALTIISYIKIPNVHQSTAEVCPWVLMTSGAMYSAK